MMRIGSTTSQIFWLGGSPCSGKSSIAEQISEKSGVSVYHLDQVLYERHIENITREEQPVIYKWHTTPWDELLALPDSAAVLVEGNVLLPDRVNEFISAPKQALWMTSS